jgi:SAM-dependent methyltransferase
VLGPRTLALLDEQVPADHARQALADDYIPTCLARLGPAPRVVDLGCGTGDSVEQFRTASGAVRWVGVDVPGSPEAAARTRRDAEFLVFDGMHLPFPDASVDLVYCKQVLEHVRAPAALLVDVARALAPGGLLAGSTSQLEPFHSLSTGNYTPYGLRRLLEDADLELLEVRPGVDALALILRRALRQPRWTDRFWATESPLNRAIGLAGRLRGWDARRTNAAKLLFAGQFCFLARRPA